MLKEEINKQKNEVTLRSEIMTREGRKEKERERGGEKILKNIVSIMIKRYALIFTHSLGRTYEFIPFLRALARRETQAASFRI